MSFTAPAYQIPRQSVAGMEHEWVKMFDPPQTGGSKGTTPMPTRDLLAPTNPVPAFIAANVPLAGMSIPNTVRRTLLHATVINMWDGKPVRFFTFGDRDIVTVSQGVYPAPTIRVPRGVVFHGWTQGDEPPPHTIHWHGIEPTPLNDGVGHCSMELGEYVYQWQPNFVGTYFYHCHRNTMQHFEFGLFGMLLIEPPDAYDDPGEFGAPGGYPRRTAANLSRFRQFPGFDPTPIDTLLPDGKPAPHAMTVPYDVEALWVLDDCDSVWRDKMASALATFPAGAGPAEVPGLQDHFFKGDFHDFNPDYFFVTGVPFVGPVGSTVPCAPDVVVPPDHNSGVTGMQVSINAQVNQTILVRILCAAYVKVRISFPLDAVVIGFDGRALGVPPLTQYNEPFVIKKGKAFELTTARRMDVLLRSRKPLDSFANVEFRHNRNDQFLLNGMIPITIK